MQYCFQSFLTSLIPSLNACSSLSPFTTSDQYPLSDSWLSVPLSSLLIPSAWLSGTHPRFYSLSASTLQNNTCIGHFIILEKFFLALPLLTMFKRSRNAPSLMDTYGILEQNSLTCHLVVCLQIGITLFTVSHRKSLWKHHEVSNEASWQTVFSWCLAILSCRYTNISSEDRRFFGLTKMNPIIGKN